MATKPNYTQALRAVTDAAETTITALTYCGAVSVSENSGATGWPRAFYFRGTVAGSSQHLQPAGSSYRIPGPFQPGDIVGYVELISAGGDSSTLNVAELAS